MEWVTIEHSNNYEVNKKGVVRRKDNGHTLQGKVIKKTRWVTLKHNKGAKIKHRVRELVATAFLENDDPKNKVRVLNLDHNTLNDHVENLKWVTKREENAYKFQHEKELQRQRQALKAGKPTPVNKFTLDGEFVQTYPTMKSAALDSGVRVVDVSWCTKGKIESINGFIFKKVEGSTTKCEGKPSSTEQDSPKER